MSKAGWIDYSLPTTPLQRNSSLIASPPPKHFKGYFMSNIVRFGRDKARVLQKPKHGKAVELHLHLARDAKSVQNLQVNTLGDLYVIEVVWPEKQAISDTPYSVFFDHATTSHPDAEMLLRKLAETYRDEGTPYLIYRYGEPCPEKKTCSISIQHFADDLAPPSRRKPGIGVFVSLNEAGSNTFEEAGIFPSWEEAEICAKEDAAEYRADGYYCTIWREHIAA